MDKVERKLFGRKQFFIDNFHDRGAMVRDPDRFFSWIRFRIKFRKNIYPVRPDRFDPDSYPVNIRPDPKICLDVYYYFSIASVIRAKEAVS